MSIVNLQSLKQNGCVLHWSGGSCSSNSTKQITPNGDCKQLLPYPGAGIGMFDGSGDYISTTHADFGTGTSNFWCGFWAYWNSASNPAANVIFAGTNYDTNQSWALVLKSTGVITVLYNYGEDEISSTTQFPKQSWNWCVVYRNSNTLYLYINNVFVGSASITGVSYSSTTFQVGYQSQRNIGNYWNGYISEVQFKVIPPTFPTSVPLRQLENDSNTKLLLHFLGSGNTFVDSSPSPKTITAYGDAKQLSSPCGSGIAYFDGTGDYLLIPDSDDLTFTGNFTMEGWIYPTSLSVDKTIFMKWVNLYQEYAIVILTTGVIQFFWGPQSVTLPFIQSSTGVISANTWYHFAVVRNSNTFSLYVNGVFITSGTCSTAVTNGIESLCIGRYYNGGTPVTSYDYIGYLSEPIFSNVARYTANFTPPTTPFKPDSYTKLLLHMDGVGNAFYDSSDPPGDNGFPILPDGVTVTPAGTFVVNKIKTGQNVWKFDGSTNYITISDHNTWSLFANDFTICGWIKFDSIAASKGIVGQYVDNNNYWSIVWDTSNIIQLYGISSGTVNFNYTCSLTAAAATWYYIAIIKTGSTCLIYIDGVSKTVTAGQAFRNTTNIASVLSIGRTISTYYQLGTTKDLMIFTKALSLDQIGALRNETYIY